MQLTWLPQDFGGSVWAYGALGHTHPTPGADEETGRGMSEFGDELARLMRARGIGCANSPA